ncbi:MAG: beta-ketoacyl-[acyl-carrier-protein] synthase family protein [Candidatus Omnitrophica bacterium]|nr:beta-ketoacyl-[acyl-carrier-protein] synthase family protein [Candidatus Omnitrophota bacterium]
MDKKRVVVTGFGIITSNGIGRSAFSEALFKGISGIKPISLFDTSEFKVKTAGEIKDFRPQDFLGDKGLRNLDRSTRLVNSAAKLALQDAGLEITDANTADTGVTIGTTLGSVNSISEFDKEAMKEGPHYVNPALFPNTVINSPSSQVSIRFNIRGFNATISTGFASSLDAINYAADFIRLGRAKTVLAGGVEELCVQTFLGFYKTGFLAGLKDSSAELSCPFDKRRNGIILGEASCILILEELESALERKVKVYAEILGFGTAFDPYRVNKYSLRTEGLKNAIGTALNKSSLDADKIDYICSGANSTIEGDLFETMCVKEVFGERTKKIPISSVKSMIGECFSASGACQAAGSICAIEKQALPPTINYQEKDDRCDLDYVTGGARNAKVDNILVNAFGPSGCNSSLVISRFRS